MRSSLGRGTQIVAPDSEGDSEELVCHRHQNPFCFAQIFTVGEECQKIRHREQFSLHAQMHALLCRFLSPSPLCLVGQPQEAVTFSGALLNSGQLSGRSRADVSDIFRDGGRQSASRDSANKNCAEKGREERTRKHFYATESC